MKVKRKMGSVYAKAVLRGLKASKTLDILVDTGATYTVLTPKLAEEIGVQKFPEKFRVSYANREREEVEGGIIAIEIHGRRVPVTVLIADCEEPLLGVEALEALGMKVNPKSGRLEPTRAFTIRV